MINFLKKITTLYGDLKHYVGKFALVGLSGILVNQGTLALLNLVLKIPVEISGAIAIELSILNNFTFNNIWTWRNSQEQPLLKKLAKYHMVTLFSGAINYLVLLTLTYLGLHVLIANLIGIGIGMSINFIFNHFWTFKN